MTAFHWTKAMFVLNVFNGTAPYYAYAVINDQKSSDGSFIPPTYRRVLWLDGPD